MRVRAGESGCWTRSKGPSPVPYIPSSKSLCVVCVRCVCVCVLFTFCAVNMVNTVKAGVARSTRSRQVSRNRLETNQSIRGRERVEKKRLALLNVWKQSDNDKHTDKGALVIVVFSSSSLPSSSSSIANTLWALAIWSADTDIAGVPLPSTLPVCLDRAHVHNTPRLRQRARTQRTESCLWQPAGGGCCPCAY